MTILRAQATASDTLDSTSPTLINGMILTDPASGEYLLHATVQCQIGTGASGRTHFLVYVGGSVIDHSERIFDEDTSVDDTTLTVMLTCMVNQNGSQDVEIRHDTTSTTSPLVAINREMCLFPIVGTDLEASATATDSTSSSTWSLLVGMSIPDPASGAPGRPRTRPSAPCRG